MCPVQFRKPLMTVTRMTKHPLRKRHEFPLSTILSRAIRLKWFSTVAERSSVTVTHGHQTSLLAMQSPVAKLSNNGIWGRDRPELLVPSPLPNPVDINIQRTVGEQNEVTARLTDKAVSWVLTPVFFCCVVAEMVKLPQTWEATEIFSQVVVNFMLRLFVLATKVAGGEQQQIAQRVEEVK